MGTALRASQAGRVSQPSCHIVAVFGPPHPAQSCPRGQDDAGEALQEHLSLHGVSAAAAARSLPPAAAPAQGWQGTREIKQAISKAKRKAAIWALTDRSFNEQREFSREAGEMQQSE